MNDNQFDHELSRALRTGPEEVSPEFNRRVLARLEEPSRRRPLRRPAFAAAALLVLALGASIALRLERAPQIDQATQREELLEEYRALELELQQIRQLTSQRQPSLYLGGDESFDLMYDLAAYQNDRSNERARPASLPDRG